MSSFGRGHEGDIKHLLQTIQPWIDSLFSHLSIFLPSLLYLLHLVHILASVSSHRRVLLFPEWGYFSLANSRVNWCH